MPRLRREVDLREIIDGDRPFVLQLSQARRCLVTPHPFMIGGDAHHEVARADVAGPRARRLVGSHGALRRPAFATTGIRTLPTARYGYIHTVVVRLPDGNFRITQEARLLVDLFGFNKEELTERGEYVVTADYRPVSISVEGKRESGLARVSGRSRGSSFEVTATIAGIERSRVFDRPEAILLGACLEDWLADRPPDFETGELTLLGKESCTPKPAKAKRLGRGQASRAWPGRSSRVTWKASSGSSSMRMDCASSGRPRGDS